MPGRHVKQRRSRFDSAVRDNGSISTRFIALAATYNTHTHLGRSEQVRHAVSEGGVDGVLGQVAADSKVVRRQALGGPLGGCSTVASRCSQLRKETSTGADTKYTRSTRHVSRAKPCASSTRQRQLERDTPAPGLASTNSRKNVKGALLRESQGHPFCVK